MLRRTGAAAGTAPKHRRRRFDMHCTCCHLIVACRSLIQIRNVPDALHRTLKVRAAEQGVSLSDLLLEELRRYAERPTLAEPRRRLQGPPRGRLRESPAEAVRAEREAR